METYSLKEGVLQGPAYGFNNYGDTTSFFGFKNGFLFGPYQRYQAGSLLRTGNYFVGEQNGLWLTHGQFNQITYSSNYGIKDVLHVTSLLPRIGFAFNPKFNVGIKYPFKKEFAKAYSFDQMEAFSGEQFASIMLSAPDSDDVLGTSWFKLNLSETGLVEEIDLIKCMSTDKELECLILLINQGLYNPYSYAGFPFKDSIYVSIDHLVE